MKVKLDKSNCIKTIFILLILFSIGISSSFCQTVFMPISEIKPGMKGIGKTVFHGTQAETFQVDIIDIVKNEGEVGNFILANLSGDKIKESGGISEGMSGSPVYINGQLIGAVSYAWEMSEHNLCLVTPIQEMLEIFNLPYNDHTALSGHNANNSLIFTYDKANKIKVKNLEKNRNFSELANSEEVIFSPIVSPVIINGMKGRTFERLGNSLKKFNLVPVQGIGLKVNNGDNFQKVGESLSNKIEAGSAIGIQLTRGDINIISIGTVTYREGNKILALGHPFLKKGEVSLLLSSVYIYHSLPNMVMPFKLGTPLNLVGKIIQDREAGILAILNSYPRVIPCKIQVTNVDSGLVYQMGIQVINDYDLLEPLVSNAAVQIIDNALDRIGAGTAQIDIEIKGEKMGQVLLRKNMYHSSSDIALQVICEIPEMIDLIANNYFEMINLNAINIDIKVDHQKKIGRIEEVVLEESSINPGDYLKLKIKIRPFRGEFIEKNLTVQIPPDTPNSEALLMVYGGKEAENQEEELANNGKKDNLSLEETFKDFSDRPRGNQVIGEVVVYSNELPFEEKNNDDSFEKKEEKDLIISKIETDMVIEGYLEIPFTILKN